VAITGLASAPWAQSDGRVPVPFAFARLRRPDPSPDPVETWELQSRLSRLAAELCGLDAGGERRFARGHHLRAAMEAYERTLDDACRLAGVPVEPGRGPAHRLLAETRLSECGWRW
jgi:hypothetical protein